MHLIGKQKSLRTYIRNWWLLSAMGVGSLLFAATAFVPIANAASPVSYTINPASSSVQPGSTVSMTVTVRTTTALAGGSVHLAFESGSYASFQPAGSANLSFVDYHTAQDDLVYICNNNACPAGTYDIAVVTVTAVQSGTMKVSLTPKETADPDLALLAADGTNGSYAINSSAPASPAPKKSQATYTVPQTNSTGGTEPLQITSEQYVQQSQAAQDVNQKSAEEAQKPASKWTVKTIALTIIGVSVGLSLVILILIKFLGGGPKDPPITPGTIIYPG
jgi:hypothetical protein